MIVVLRGSEIWTRQLRLAEYAKKVALISYNVHQAWNGWHLCEDTRLIVGLPDSISERQAVIETKVQALASRYPTLDIRVLPGSHVKLALFWRDRRRIDAIVGSMNLGQAHYHELAVEVDGAPAQELARCYETYWRLATPVKSLDTKAIAAVLSSGSFEA